MLRLALIIAISIAILSPAQRESRSADGTSRFVSLEGRFSISLPDGSDFRKPTRLIIPTPSGEAHGSLFEWQTKEGTLSIGYADSFQRIRDPKAIKRFFDEATERFRKLAANGDKIAVKKITLDDYPGIEQRADIFTGSLIERLYLVSRRIYKTVVVVNTNQPDMSTAVGVLDSFKLLSDPEITEAARKVGPAPLPQTREAPRAGSDAADEGLHGPVKSVRTEIQYLSETPLTRMGTHSWLTTYNEEGNKLRTESYDFKNNLEQIEVFGYLDGSRVSASEFIQREYSPPFVTTGLDGSFPSSKAPDPRYGHRFEFKYDEKKRLTEMTDFLSNGELLRRHVYKYEGNQKEELVYARNGSLLWHDLYILDDKGNQIERTNFAHDGTVFSTSSFTYEFDSNGNWTKQTTSWKAHSDKPRFEPPSVRLRTITYY